jgi:uncharacterized membrane protein
MEGGMALLRSWLDAAPLSAALLLAAPSARAEEGQISFCNEFPHKVFVAIAYLQTDVNNYLSRGWLEIETGKCYVFDTAIRVPTFYYRAESETYRDGKHKVKMNWGNEKKFAVRDANFQSYNAEKAYSGMHLTDFSKAPDSRDGGPLTVIVTFSEKGTNTVVPGPGEPAAQSSGGGGASQAPQTAPAPQAAEPAPTPSAAGSEGGIEDKSEAGSAGGNSPASDTAGNGRDSGPRQ